MIATGKTFLLPVFVLFGCTLLLTEAADDPETMDKELMAKLFSSILKCFKDTDWNACGEMLKIKYDITQPKYKQCTCSMACTGEDFGLFDKDGQPQHAKFLEIVKNINNQGIKGQLQTIYDKCHTVKGADKCELSEKFVACAFEESPKLKERMSTLIETIAKMKQP